MKKLKKEIVFWLVVLIFTIIVVILSITSQKAYAAETLPSDVIKALGYSDEDIINVDDYEYHFMVKNGDSIIHYYSDIPFKMSFRISLNRDYEFRLTNLKWLNDRWNCIRYNRNGIGVPWYEDNHNYDGVFMIFQNYVTNGINKEELLFHNYNPSYPLSSDVNKVFFVKGAIGIQVADDSLSDIGYVKNSLFFFQGNYSQGNSVSPLAPGGDIPIDDGSISDSDKSWFGGLFSGIEESIVNLATTIESGIINAFQSIADFIMNGIEAILVPDTENMNLKIDEIKSYFSFVDGIKLTVEEVKTFFDNVEDGEIPSVTVNLSRYEGKYDIGETAEAIDLSWYSRYKPFIDNLIVAFVYITFLFNLFRRLPDIIAGAGAVVSPPSYSKIDMYIEDKGGKK